jgi:hypothetical protein
VKKNRIAPAKKLNISDSGSCERFGRPIDSRFGAILDEKFAL